MENIEKTYEMEMEEAAMMPEGWAEGDDFFDSDSWTGGKASAAESEDGADESAVENTEAEEAPATEQPAEEEVEQESEAQAPATEQQAETPSNKIRVKYQFDHKDVEEDIDPADLPELMQKARSIDRYKERASQMQGIEAESKQASAVAKVLGYQSTAEMLNAVLENARTGERQSLLDKGNSEEIVDDYLSRKYGAPQVQPETSPQPAENAFAQQAQELLSEFPTLRGTQLPEEVIKASASGAKTLLTAYREYKEKLETAERETLRKENQILKQNAAAAAKAPVSGVSKGGSSKVTAEDDFLRGFNSDW